MNFRIGLRRKKISNRLQDVAYQGKNQPVVLMVPYGMFANPKTDTTMGILADQGNEESQYAIPFEIKDLEELADGEIAFGIPGKTARVKFLDNDKIALYNSLISMLEILEGLIDEVKAITTTGSSTAQSVSPASQALLEAYKLEVNKLLNGS